jgi:hypothetical protein
MTTKWNCSPEEFRRLRRTTRSAGFVRNSQSLSGSSIPSPVQVARWRRGPERSSSLLWQPHISNSVNWMMPPHGRSAHSISAWIARRRRSGGLSTESSVPRRQTRLGPGGSGLQERPCRGSTAKPMLDTLASATNGCVHCLPERLIRATRAISARFWGLMGFNLFRSNDVGGARDCTAKALESCRTSGDVDGIRIHEFNLVFINSNTGTLDQPREDNSAINIAMTSDPTSE